GGGGKGGGKAEGSGRGEEGQGEVEKRLEPLLGRGRAEAEEEVVPGLGLAVAGVTEGHAAAAVEPAALAQVNRRVAIELPAGVPVPGEEQIAAGPELEVPPHGNADLAAEAPGVIFEVPSHPRPDGDRALDQRAAAAVLRARRLRRERREEQAHEHEASPGRHPISEADKELKSTRVGCGQATERSR